MVTGDNLAIAREIAGTLGLGKNIRKADQLFTETKITDDDLAIRTEAADGFAQVFPEHKFSIVKRNNFV